MADLLNEIVEQGGTTAITQKVSRDDLLEWIRHYSGRNAWFVAENDDGELLGFQWIEPSDDIPSEACSIATFTRRGRTRLGCGTALFESTRLAAKTLGYKWINATIRADNEGGLAYYQSRSFETYRTDRSVELANGLIVDRVRQRYNL